MDAVNTICPSCFKVFPVSEEFDQVKCERCNYEYELPKIKPRKSFLGEMYG